jgi:thiamine monophosphate synthase
MLSLPRKLMWAAHSTEELKRRPRAATEYQCVGRTMTTKTHNLQLSKGSELLEIALQKHSKGAVLHPWGDYSR